MRYVAAAVVLILAVVAAYASGTDVAVPGLQPGVGLFRLDADCLQLVLDRIPDLASYRRLASSCRYMRWTCTLPLLLQRLFCGVVPDTELASAIESVTAQIRRCPQLADRITPQLATGLYDRLVGNPTLVGDVKSDLVRALAASVPAFGAVVLAPDWDHCPVELALALPYLGQLPKPVSALLHRVREVVTQQAGYLRRPWRAAESATVVTAADAWRSYPPPLREIVSHHGHIADRLLRSDAVALDEPVTLHALQRYGIRFGVFAFLDAVEFPAALVPDIVPLLYVPHLYPRSLFVLAALSSDRPNHARALFDIPPFRAEMLADPGRFVTALNALMDLDLVPYFRVLIRVPCMSDIVNVADRNGWTLLYSAVRAQKAEIARLLLHIPTVDLYRTYPDNDTVFDHIFVTDDPDRLESRIRTFSDLLSSSVLTARILSDVAAFVTFLMPLLERRQFGVVQVLTQCEFFQRILGLRPYRLRLLQRAQSCPEIHQLLLQSCPKPELHCPIPCAIL